MVTERKSKGSTKSLGFNVCKPWMSVQIHPGEIRQSGPRRFDRRHFQPRGLKEENKWNHLNIMFLLEGLLAFKMSVSIKDDRNGFPHTLRC